MIYPLWRLYNFHIMIYNVEMYGECACLKESISIVQQTLCSLYRVETIRHCLKPLFLLKTFINSVKIPPKLAIFIIIH